MVMRRRAFLAGAVGAVGAHATKSPAWKMRLSASSVLFNTLPVEQACARIADAGYEAVDLWQGDQFRTNHLNEALDRLHPDGLAELLAARKLALCSFTRFFDGIEPYGALLGAAGHGEGLYIRESRYYGTGPSRGATRPKDLADLRSQLASVVESLKPQLELADRHNFQVAIENHASAILNSLDSFKIFRDLARHPRLWIALAPYHLQRDHIRVEDVVAAVGDRIRFFYAWQNEPEVNQLPGFGSTDFTPWLKSLAQANYRGYVNPFMHENLSAAPGEDRHALSPDAMSSAIVKARQYLEQCTVRF